MTPRLRRILITVIVGSVALAIALTAMLTPRSTPSPAQPSQPSQQQSTPAVSEGSEQPPSDETVVASADDEMTEPVSAPALEGLHAVAPAEGESDPNVSAASLGVDVRRARWFLLVVVTLLTAVLVSVCGAIGFVGLVVPHAVRLVVGSRNHRVLPVAAVVGALFLLLADTAARTVFEPRELPVGILTAAIGAPVFAVLLRRSRL